MPRGPLLFILVTLFLDAVGIGLIFPVMPDLIGAVRPGSIGDAALWGGLLATVYAVMQFLCAPVIGALSDRFGRRPVLLVSLAVMALDYVGSALAGSIGLLVALRVVAGIAAATQATANAAIADITPPEKRAETFGLLGAAFIAGFILGPVAGGLLGEIGPRAPFWAAAILATANLALGWFTLPETVTDATRRPLTWARSAPWGAVRSVVRLTGTRPLLALLFIQDVAFIAYPAIWAFWGKAAFGWSPLVIGVSLAAFGAASAIVQGYGIRLYLRWFGEGGTIVFSTVLSLLAFLAYAVLPASPLGSWLALILCPLSALGEGTLPALQARISRLAPADAQGEVQGVIASTRSAALVIGPLLMTAIFAAAADADGWRLYGAPYLLSALLMALSLVLFQRTRGPEPAPAT